MLYNVPYPILRKEEEKTSSDVIRTIIIIKILPVAISTLLQISYRHYTHEIRGGGELDLSWCEVSSVKMEKHTCELS